MEKLVEEILSFFPEFRINVNDLKSPTASLVRDFYCRVLMEFGVDVENVRKIQMNQMDLHEMDIIPELNLVSAVRTAFPFLGFRLNDIISPEIKRNITLMSNVMAFLQFCDARCAENNVHIEEIQKAKHSEMELIKIKDKESTLLNNLAREVDEFIQTKEKMESDIKKLENEIFKYKEEKKDISGPREEAQELLSEKERRIHSLETEIQMMNKEYEELRKLLVNNPDEEQRDLDSKTRDREKVLERKKDYQEKLKSLNENKEKLQRQSEMLNKKVMPILQELQILQKYSKIKEFNEKSKETMKELQKKKEELVKSIEEIGKKIEIEEMNSNKRLAELEKEDATLRENLESKKSDYRFKSREVKLTQRTSKQELEKVLSRISSLENDYEILLSIFNRVKELICLKMSEMYQRCDL